MNIVNWEKLIVPKGMHHAPDSPGGVVRGNVYGHPEIIDGAVFTTDVILGWDFRDFCFVDAAGREYRLREPDPDYEKRFPNAKANVEKAIIARKFMMSSADYAKRLVEGNAA